MSILPPIIRRCAGAERPENACQRPSKRRAVESAHCGALFRNSTSTDPDFWVLERAPDTLTYTAV
jgi:hypothetical protein